MSVATRSTARSIRGSQSSEVSLGSTSATRAPENATRQHRGQRRGTDRPSGHPPSYTIDLSRPPAERYTQICHDFKDQINELAKLYDDVLKLSGHPRLFRVLAKWCLKRVKEEEETEEIKGIAKTSGIPLHLVVAYNTFLDLFSGCVSGGVRVHDQLDQGGKILHFRGLDWGMEPLRDMIIQAEYIRDGKVVARAVTYAGYVGTLTGVREGLSISLNYRARIISSKSTLVHRWHQLCLLLGWRPSISSQLHRILLDPGPVPTIEFLAHHFKHTRASPCYLTFCSPSSILVLEKDLGDAQSQSGEDFLAVTNHDQDMEKWDAVEWNEIVEACGIQDVGGVHEIMKDSIERKGCVLGLWKDRIGELEGLPASSSRRRMAPGRVTKEDVKEWLRTYPVRNESTHFSCIMDPAVAGGGLVWVEAFDGEV